VARFLVRFRRAGYIDPWGRRAAPIFLAFFRRICVIARLGKLTATDKIRRNHALEHAAISIVTERHPATFLRGRANRRGFYVFGEIETPELESAIDEGLRRLRAGESHLAVHPRCGTNLAVAGILSGLAAAGAAQLRPRRNRFSYAVLAAMGALAVAPRLGAETQRHVTTLADPGSLRVQSVERRRFPLTGETMHWVKTGFEP
jgi:hypothetical protein